jgi:hypothetical protein
MFEGHNAAYAGFLEGVNRRMARDADAALQSWKDATAAWKAACSRLESQLEEANARIAELELALAVEKAHAGGLTAMFMDIKAACPNSPTLRDSGKRFKDGKPKTMGRLVYEREHDRILRDARISNPEKYRAD